TFGMERSVPVKIGDLQAPNGQQYNPRRDREQVAIKDRLVPIIADEVAYFRYGKVCSGQDW
ncbi:hypothetical protein, partial [Salmonella enterica]|uniref:hypothetical protein n=1 Tax=Salmonella enterica TaxID=28901 RepID=UPI0031366B9E